jgi:hypothetical protein
MDNNIMRLGYIVDLDETKCQVKLQFYSGERKWFPANEVTHTNQ